VQVAPPAGFGLCNCHCESILLRVRFAPLSLPQFAKSILPLSRQRGLFSVIIGINDYGVVLELVADALSVKDYLENSLHVSIRQIHTLLNKLVSCSAIIEAFKKSAKRRTHPRSPHFYLLRRSWRRNTSSGEAKYKSLCCRTTNTANHPRKKNPATPDRTIGLLIAQIAEEKGDNFVRSSHFSSSQGIFALTLVFNWCRDEVRLLFSRE